MFGFVRWWWARRDSSERILTVCLVWGISSLISMPFLGLLGLSIFITGILLTVVCVICYQMYLSIRNQIESYRQERDRERQYIVDKLAGRRS